MKSYNQPYYKHKDETSKLLNPITKENPYLSLMAIPRKDEKGEPMEPFIMPSRKQRRTSHKYIQLVDGTRLKTHGNNRKPFPKNTKGRRNSGRSQRF